MIFSKDITDNTTRIFKLLGQNLASVHPKVSSVVKSIESNINDVQLNDAMDYLVNIFTKLVS